MRERNDRLVWPLHDASRVLVRLCCNCCRPKTRPSEALPDFVDQGSAEQQVDTSIQSLPKQSVEKTEIE